MSKDKHNHLSEEEENEEEGDANSRRQDLCVFISSERELRSAERIRLKASQYTGLAIRAKTLTVA